MEHISPLLQTLLWVGLVAGIVIRFHKQIDGLLEALQKRIDAGSPIEAGPFKLGEVKPTPPVEQRQRAEQELAQIVQDQLGGPETQAPEVAAEAPAVATPKPAPVPVHVPGATEGAATPDDDQRNESPDSGATPSADLLRRSDPSRLRSRFFQAEELALRAVQTEFDQPINRQVSMAPGIQADGAFMLGGDLYLVEVKYIVRPKNAASTVSRTLDHYRRAFGPTRARLVTIVLALVFEYESDVSSSTLEFQELANEYGLRVQVRGYSLKDLRSMYGLSSDEA